MTQPQCASQTTSSLQELVTAASKRWISMDDLYDQANVDCTEGVDKEELKKLLEQLRLVNSVNFDCVWNALNKEGEKITKDEWRAGFDGIEPIAECSSHAIDWIVKPKYRDDTPGGLVGLVAHNKMKPQMATFVESNVNFFKHCRIVTTGSTGSTLEGKLGLKVHHKVASGPLGGDQEIGALVTQGLVSAIFFFKDPLSAHQHAADIEALTRICDVHNVPYATNSASGKGLITAMASLGLGFGNAGESNTVKEYKEEQKRVIRMVSGSDHQK